MKKSDVFHVEQPFLSPNASAITHDRIVGPYHPMAGYNDG